MNKFRIAKAGISVNEGIQRLGGSVDDFQELLSHFPEDTHYQEMISAIKEGSAEKAFQAAHALKGITGNMSMTGLHEALCPAVEVFRNGGLDIEEFLPKIEEAYNKVFDAIVEMNKK